MGNELIDMMAEMKIKYAEKRRLHKDQTRKDGKRVERKIRMISRPICCSCKGTPGVKRDWTCAGRLVRCPTCMMSEPHPETGKPRCQLEALTAR